MIHFFSYFLQKKNPPGSHGIWSVFFLPSLRGLWFFFTDVSSSVADSWGFFFVRHRSHIPCSGREEGHLVYIPSCSIIFDNTAGAHELAIHGGCTDWAGIIISTKVHVCAYVHLILAKHRYISHKPTFIKNRDAVLEKCGQASGAQHQVSGALH